MHRRSTMTTASHGGAPDDRAAGRPGEAPADTGAAPVAVASDRRRDPAGAGVLLLTPLVLVLLMVVGLVISWADRAAGSNTYRANGVSFDYPARWQEGPVRSFPSVRPPEWRVGIGDEDDQYDAVVVSARRLSGWVAAEEVPAMKPSIERLF